MISARSLSLHFIGMFTIIAIFFSPLHAEDLIILDENGEEIENYDSDEVQAGTIEIEQATKQRDPYFDSQDNAISLIESLLGQEKALSRSAIPSPEDGTLLHLAGTYLYCTAQSGTCPFILDSVLEVDVYNSILSGQASCPTMLRFWKQWVDNDMQKKQGYLIKTGHLRKMAAFKKKQLPGYLKCKSLVSAALNEKGKKSNDTYFAERYKGESAITKSLSQTKNLLSALKKKGINVHRATNR